MRLHEELHKDKPFHDGSFRIWAEKPSKLTPFHYADGMRFFMSPVELAPWDEWVTDSNASPVKPEGWGESVAEQSPEQ